MKSLNVIACVFAQAALAFIAICASGKLLVSATPLPDMTRFTFRSQIVEAASGDPLWGFLAGDGRWRLRATTSEVDPKYLGFLLAYEDKRFRSHPGFDVLAFARATFETIRRGQSSSGASTLTMQTVRLLEPQPRTIESKLDQILKALKIERRFSKDEILEIYLTLAPFGGNIDGVRAASLIYFGKEPKRLSVGEAAMLVAIPQAPESRRPDRQLQAAQLAKIRVLRTLAARRMIDPRMEQLVRRETPIAESRALANAAPYFAQRVRRVAANRETVRTLIDRDIQHNVEQLATKAIGQWDEAVNIAVVVLRNRDASFAAYVGGVDFGAQSRAGYVDLTQAVRSPGSTLKPFIYSVAFEKLIVRPNTIITDKPIEIDGYRPDNADGKFMGDLTVRQALARSRNTTAVMLLQKVGVDEILGRFRGTGRPLILPEAANPSAGLATALGGEGVTLEQLTWFYSAFARDGKLMALRATDEDPVVVRGALMSKYAARAAADILADVPPPAGFERLAALDGSRRVGFKTGTSFGFRDAWAVGFDELHTVGVWVGRPDGAAHLGAYGVTAAAPLLMQIFEALPVPKNGIRSVEENFGASRGGPSPLSRLERFEAKAGDRTALSIFYPKSGANIVSAARRGDPVPITVIAEGGRGPYTWRLPGSGQAVTDGPTLTWSFESRGQCVVRVTDSAGRDAETSFWLD